MVFIQLTCLTVLSNNLFPGPLWSSPWSWALNLILHAFFHQIIIVDGVDVVRGKRAPVHLPAKQLAGRLRETQTEVRQLTHEEQRDHAHTWLRPPSVTTPIMRDDAYRLKGDEHARKLSELPSSVTTPTTNMTTPTKCDHARSRP